MEASVEVSPVSATVVNLNDFPWYGLVMTIDDRYTNRSFLDNPDRPYLRHDSMVGPGETENVGFGNDFFDEDGNQWKAVPYRITVKKIKLEAKFPVDGPYDLMKTMSLSSSSEPENPQPPLHVKSGDLPGLLITSDAPGYEAVKDKLQGVEADSALTHRVSLEMYEEIKVMLGIEDNPEDEARIARWKEQWDHWPNIDAFKANVEAFTADRVIDREELDRICFVMPQWEKQLRAARDYVVNYRQVEPDTAEENPGLGNLEAEAERGLALLANTECP